MATLSEHTNVLDLINEEAEGIGLPPWIPATIAYHESGLNPNAVNHDSNGSTDYGLFQLNTEGLGAGYSPSQLENPYTNIGIAEPKMLTAYKAGVQQGLKGTDLLNYVANNSGWPSSAGVSWTQANTTYDHNSAGTGLDDQYNSWTTKIYNVNADPSMPNSIKSLDKADIATGSGQWGSGLLNLFGVNNVYMIIFIIVGILLCAFLAFRIFTH